MSIIDQMRVLLREQRERAEDRKAAIKPDPPHVTVAAWQIDAAKFASNVAMCVLVYMLWLYTLQIAGDRAGEMHLTRAGTWTGDLQFWFPYLVGFALISFGVPYVAKISIPTFMALTWREAPWPKGWALAIAMSVSLVIIAGTFTIQGDAILERDRDSAVAVAGIEQNRAGLQARIDGITADLNTMMNNSNAYLAQAASVGAAEWENTYIANARASRDPQTGRIERALGAARSADTLRAERDTLRQQLAAAPVAETAQRRVEGASTATSFIGSMLDWVEGIRAILLSLVMDVVCLMMPWIARHLELTRNRQLGAQVMPWADDAHSIPDLREAEPVIVRSKEEDAKMQAPMVDGETGRPMVHRKATWAKKPTARKAMSEIDKLRRERVSLAKRMNRASVIELDSLRAKDGELLDQIAALQREAEEAPDETGAPDGGARAGSVDFDAVGAAVDPLADTPIEAGAEPQEIDEAQSDDGPRDTEALSDVHSITPPDLTEDDMLALYPEIAPDASAEPAAAVETIALGSDGADGVMQTEEQQDAHVRAREMEAA